VGKLAVQGRLNAVGPGALVHIQDQLSKRRFLVDTGASFSIFPHHSSAPASGPVLSGPSGKTIPCWGEKFLTLSFHGKTFTWTFLLAAVQFPILGVDFLRHYKFLRGEAATCTASAGYKTSDICPSCCLSTPGLVLSAVRLYTPGGRRASTCSFISGAIQSYQQEQQVFQPRGRLPYRGRVRRPPQAAPGRTGRDAGPAASARPPFGGRYLPVFFIASSSSYPRLGGALWRKQRRS
jgi:hypothetical protein